MQEAQPKRGKKGRRKRNDSEEDIQKELAQLELEYSGQKKEEPSDSVEQHNDDDEDKKKKEKKGKEKGKAKVIDTKEELKALDGLDENDMDDDIEISTVKTAAQKKKEKKNKEKRKAEFIDTKEELKALDGLDENDMDDNIEISTVKTAAQKKKEKKNKEKRKAEVIDTKDELKALDGLDENDMDDDIEISTVKTAAQKKKEKRNKEKEKAEVVSVTKEQLKALDGLYGDDMVEEIQISFVKTAAQKKKEKRNKEKEKVEVIDTKEELKALDGLDEDDMYDEHDFIMVKTVAQKKKEKKNKEKEKAEVIDSKEELKASDELDEDDMDDDIEISTVKTAAQKKKEKKNKEKEKAEVIDSKEELKASDELDEDDMDDDIEISTVKTAAQKKKEKKEREKQKKMALKKAEIVKKMDQNETNDVEPPANETKIEPKKETKKDAKKEQKKQPEVTVPEPSDMDTAPGEGEEGKKKKKKGAKEDIKEKDKGKGPGKKTIAAMQEALKKLKEDEERMKREEEERLKQEEIQEQQRQELMRLEQERKERKKLKEKQRKERLKAEGKLLTTKQKQDRARAQAMIAALKAQGLDLPEVGEKKPRAGTRIRPNKLKQQTSVDEKDDDKMDDSMTDTDKVEVEIVDQQMKDSEEKAEDVKDSWDAESSEEEQEEDKSDDVPKTPDKVSATKTKRTDESGKDSSESDSESESGSESDSEESEDDSELEDKVSDAMRKKERAKVRIQCRRIDAEKKKSLDNLRAAVVCVLGHVDTGKTKILDKLRRTNVQDGEAGGITQQIGATNVPIDAIQESTRHVKGFADKILRIPGLLIIDTPGHESFSNLRNRGSSLCDIAILVVDIMHGLEPQTIESIDLLKSKKCPFIVALNKIDRLYDWQTMNRKDIQDIVKSQAINTQREFEKRSKDVIVQFAEQGLNAALFYENPDPRSYVSLVPTSAITGEGMGNLLSLIVDACQGPLAKRLMYSDELQATVLEVKALPGLGTTIDCILVNGMLREGETMIVAGTDGPIVTQIRSLLMPQPLKELRVKSAYIEHREVQAAQGVKIAAKDLEKAIAGLNLQVAQKPDEVEILKEEIAKELSSALGNIRLAERGVYVQASTLGALEALLDFLKSSKIPYAGIRIGPVVKKDVMKASIMLEHDSQYATILAFDVKIERDAQELADSLGVKIFQADIIYHLFDKFTSYREELKQRKRDENKHIAVFPCKLRILPQHIFNSRDPIVMGVMVEAGIVKEGTPLCVPSKDFLELGMVTSIEYNHKPVESARKGQEVCVKIEPIPGEAPKMYGRHFDEKDFVISKISRQSIDACKEYFRDDLVKTDWQLMVELKKLFQIL